MTPVVFGLLAALGWGIADFLVARAGDRVGPNTTFAYSQAVGALAVVGFAVATDAPLSVPLGALGGLVAVALLGAGSYLLLYRALAVGPVAVTSPVAATYGAVAAIFGVAVLGETLSTRGAVGAGLVTLGVVAASADAENAGSLSPQSLSADAMPGVLLAAGASLGLGATLFLLKVLGEAVGLLALILAIRIVGASLAGPIASRPPQSLLPTIAAVGVLDAGAFVAYLLGVSSGQVSVVSPLGSLFAVVTVALSRVFLDESLARSQQAGIALVLAGTPLLAG